jgi:hypothetical protein
MFYQENTYDCGVFVLRYMEVRSTTFFTLARFFDLFVVLKIVSETCFELLQWFQRGERSLLQYLRYRLFLGPLSFSYPRAISTFHPPCSLSSPKLKNQSVTFR